MEISLKKVGIIVVLTLVLSIASTVALFYALPQKEDNREWKEILVFTGNSTETTDSFEINCTNWRVLWIVFFDFTNEDAGNFSFNIPNRNDFNLRSTQGSSQSGNWRLCVFNWRTDGTLYNFDVTANNVHSWALTVEEYS